MNIQYYSKFVCFLCAFVNRVCVCVCVIVFMDLKELTDPLNAADMDTFTLCKNLLLMGKLYI